ncbi:hypothetical protein HHK36_027520 [Tetracentron sinense]|uniref:PH domain-containing protein n=1 Tax=Tetracentron sinense TaxID=13715 RepID=A0A835D1N0_TETSI|nr:hypothetical protein HHK36_027520 [Tetracentron sinense]
MCSGIRISNRRVIALLPNAEPMYACLIYQCTTIMYHPAIVPVGRIFADMACTGWILDNITTATAVVDPCSQLLESEIRFMDDSLGKIKVFPNHFEASTPAGDSLQKKNSANSDPRTDCSFRSHSRLWARRKFIGTASMLNLFNLPGLPWRSGTDGQDKVELTATEVESLRSELADLEEREAHLKAQLEHLDEILRSARLAGYLYIRTRWTALPGEPPIDDTDVDDWLPRFVVLHGSCIFFFILSTDLSPQDSTLLSDVVEVGPLPSFTREDEQIRYPFYILTCHGLRFECSSLSKIQVDSWMTALRIDCNLGPETTTPKDSSKT